MRRGRAPTRFGQSACTPPDNWPINGREARGPERILPGKGAVEGDCSEARCTQLRAPSRPERARGCEPGQGSRILLAQLGAEEAESSFSEVKRPRLPRTDQNFAQTGMCGARP